MMFLFSQNIVLAQTTSTPITCDVDNIARKITGIYLEKGEGYIFSIDKEGNMPIMDFVTKFNGDLSINEQECLQQKLISNFSWNVSVEYWDGNTYGSNVIKESKLGAQRQGKTSGDYWEYTKQNTPYAVTISPQDLGNKYGGGIGLITTTFAYKDIKWQAQTKIRINADKDISKVEYKKELGELKYQVLGYLESNFTHFVKDGTPLLNCANADCSESDGGFGIMQITDCIGAEGTLKSISTKKDRQTHGFPTLKQIWNWKDNVAVGKSCYEVKIQNHCANIKNANDKTTCGYTYYNGSQIYGDRGSTILNEIKKGKFRKSWY